MFIAGLESRAFRQVAQIPSELGVRQVFAEIKGAATARERAEVIGDYLENTGNNLTETTGEGSDVRINRRLQGYLLARQEREQIIK